MVILAHRCLLIIWWTTRKLSFYEKQAVLIYSCSLSHPHELQSYIFNRSFPILMIYTRRKFEAWKRKRIQLLEQEIKLVEASLHEHARVESLKLQIEDTRSFSFHQWMIDQRQMEFEFPAS